MGILSCNRAKYILLKFKKKSRTGDIDNIKIVCTIPDDEIVHIKTDRSAMVYFVYFLWVGRIFSNAAGKEGKRGGRRKKAGNLRRKRDGCDHRAAGDSTRKTYPIW